MFGTHPFQKYAETDVRETIIRPLLEKLGYSREMITTELPLTYDRLFLGRKKGQSKDRVLRGQADYIVDVDGRLRLVFEAKQPGKIIDDDREQAYSYAMHPQVRALFFAVISGTHFEIFSTFHRPEAGPLLKFTYEELAEKFDALQNLIGPEALRREYPDFVIDVGKPLAPGLRSFAKVQMGKLTYTKAPPGVNGIVGLVVHLIGGSLIRRSEGGIEAIVVPSFHNKALSDFSAAIDALKVELATEAETISCDESAPTIFRGTREIAVAEGVTVPSFESLATTHAIRSVRSEVEAIVTGSMKGKTFTGSLIARATNSHLVVPVEIGANIELTLE